MRSTIYNRPLPRLKPQPRSIGNMIRKRVRARERRGEQYALLKGWDEDMRLERRLEQTALAKMKTEGVNGEEVENLDLGNDWSEIMLFTHVLFDAHSYFHWLMNRLINTRASTKYSQKYKP